MARQPANRHANKKRIFIVDDHPLMRQGMAVLINQQSDLMLCGEAEDALTAMKSIDRLRPDLVLVDISLQGMDGVELIKHLKARYPRLSVLVISMHDGSLYAERVLRAGARGYVMKQEATERVIQAIRCVLKGGIAVSEGLASKMLRKFVQNGVDSSGSGIEILSHRELEVFRLIGQGATTRQIAVKLKLSMKTIEAYRDHIKQKLQLTNATELVHYAIQWSQAESKER